MSLALEAPTTWQPLLSGEEARRADWMIGRLGAFLQRPEIVAVLPAGVSRGFAGVATFYAYLSKARPGEGWEELAMDRIERAVDRLDTDVTGPGLFAGFAGVAWAVDHFQTHVFGGDDDYNARIDEILLDHMDQGPRPAFFELIQGLAGFGVYGAGRLDRGAGRAIVARAVQRLEEEAREVGGGITWLTGPTLMPDWQLPRYPEGYHDMGVAHGVPGVIGFLGLAVEAGVEAPRARRLMEGAMAWLLAQRLDPAVGGSVLARTQAPDGTPDFMASKAAWCYGDLGASVTLLGAARRAGREDWEAEALALARGVVARIPEGPQSLDSALCHGAMGATHLFMRLHHATGEAAFRDAARRCWEAVLPFWDGTPGAERFRFGQAPGEESGAKWTYEAGLLAGTAGMGLGLLSLVHPLEPAWDRFLLADVPLGPSA